MALTRRRLLSEFGLLSGAGASLAAMQMLGVASPGSAKAAGFALPSGSGAGKRVVVLGAGIAGLVAAIELRKAGYAVTVLEAQQRVGGRVLTMRGNDQLVQVDRPLQRANFSAGQYFNAGAARLPSSHHVILGYARQLGVPMEIFVNTNRAAGWDFGGKIHRERQMIFDLQGRLAELLVTAMDHRGLDTVMPKADRDLFRRFLRNWGGLDPNGKLQPFPNSGFATEPGGYDRPGVPLQPLGLKEILSGPAVGLPLVFEAIIDMQATMLQPVGGMDRIAAAMFEQVKSSVRLGVPVTAIRREGAGVRIEHGSEATRADYCICTLPAPILARIPSDFAPAKKAALRHVEYLKSAKVAFEAPRFWETDEGIYGGNAWTDRLNENVMYPSGGVHGERGVIVGAYVAGWTNQGNPDKFAALPIAEQIRLSAASIEALHPGKSRLLSSPIAINWGQVPWSEGVGAVGRNFGGEKRGPAYTELLKPEGPIAFAGEHLSYVGLWQEGSALSAHEAMRIVQEMATGHKVG